MKIFISYSHADSNVVIPFAEELTKLYGNDSILIDEFRVKPGDSLIGFMNESLKTFSHFIFFISKHSIDSYMVSLEWQNALILCKDQSRRFIPIIVDSTEIPAILNDKHYINLYEIGFRQAFQLLKDSLNDIKPEINRTENIEAHVSYKNDILELVIKANIYTESNSSFCIVFDGNGHVVPQNFEPFTGSTEEHLINGKQMKLLFVRLFRSLTPTSPFYISFKISGDTRLYSVMHVEDINGEAVGAPIKIVI